MALSAVRRLSKGGRRDETLPRAGRVGARQVRFGKADVGERDVAHAVESAAAGPPIGERFDPVDHGKQRAEHQAGSGVDKVGCGRSKGHDEPLISQFSILYRAPALGWVQMRTPPLLPK